MSGSHANISIFVPHLGCPNMCSFCNQRYIAGDTSAPSASDVDSAVEIATCSRNYNPETTEIAFFGGSFTDIEHGYMTRLLKAAYKHVQSGLVSGIRISTRPDAVDSEILDLLKAFGVKVVELGAQSMCDEVLKLNRRGHSSADVSRACELIKKKQILLGLQMMTGLYGSNEETDIKTAEKLIELKPETVRIYPTIVLENTELCDRYKSGEYDPQTVENAAKLCCKLLLRFRENGINVIRTGLHTIDLKHYAAGPWHPAFREICDSMIFQEKARKKLSEPGNYIIFVNEKDISKMTGQKRSNLTALAKDGFNCRVVGNKDIESDDIIIRRM